MRTARKLLITAAAAVTALALAGCADTSMTGMDHGGDPSSNPSTDSNTASAAGANGADIAFATMMIPHHEQAVEMSELLLAEPELGEPVRALAEGVMAAQQPEIDQLRDWLAEWGQEEVDMGGMDHGDGMMSEDDLAVLEAAAGAEAERLYLEQMIVHHEGAVAMAEAEIADGAHPDAVAMAERIVATQSDEIALMQELLGVSPRG
ncbi:DUF305 domain-containing protein [Agromyces italicus]|uniref:DUF305 domain-containing protein n=1 Tax=Agromyces italicus TaxID=279572 RepID=UPI0003B6C55E|nr:DUF305 domain-containing protein [Agromyces italicus]